MTFIGHNIKYDATMSMYNFGCKCPNLICTMIADQKLYQNNGYNPINNPKGMRFRLDYVMQKHLGFVPTETDKSIRNYFIGLKPSQAKYTDKHISYAAGDVKYLEDIWQKQKVLAKRWKLLWFLENVEFPLIAVLGKCENNGFEFNTTKWKENIEENIKLRNNYLSELDSEFRRLRKVYCTGGLLKGGKWDRKRSTKTIEESIDLFGNTIVVKETTSKNLINWASSDTVLTILAAFNLPAPLQGETYKKYKYLIPVIVGGKLNKTCGIGKNNEVIHLENSNKVGQGWTVGNVAWRRYLIDWQHTPFKKMINLLGKFSKINTQLTNFGENYIDKVNPKTNRIHTIYRQMNTVNGRLQSGGGNISPEMRMRYNSQNIPRDSKFRHCFHAGKDNLVATCDLSGAEVTFMCDKANDEKLYEWAVINDDSHSPMVQNVWRHIYLYRAGKHAKLWKNFQQFKHRHKKVSNIKILENGNEIVRHWFNKYETFIVSKTVNKPYRQAGKNGTFGGVYGMGAKKAQETFNGTDAELAKVSEEYETSDVTYEEGKVIIYAQRQAIPKTYAMVEANVQKGMNNGFLVLNERSNSRIWLPEVVRLKRAIKEELESMNKDSSDYYKDGKWNVVATGDWYEIDFKYKLDYEGQLRNVPISGSQADCLKEAMVEIDKWIHKNDLDDKCKLLGQVHDELIYSFPKNLDIDFPNVIKETMIECANNYLTKFKMKADVEIKESWTK